MKQKVEHKPKKERKVYDNTWYVFLMCEAARRGMTMRDIADATGRKTSYLTWYESTGTIPSIEVLDEVAKVLGINPNTIPYYNEAKHCAKLRKSLAIENAKEIYAHCPCTVCLYRAKGSIPRCFHCGTGADDEPPVEHCMFYVAAHKHEVTVFERCLLQYYIFEEGDELERYEAFKEACNPANIPLYALKCWEKEKNHDYPGCRNPFGIMLLEIWDHKVSADRGSTPEDFQKVLEMRCR